MAEAIIERLNKNGDRVYLLTGQRENKPLRQKVFEKYNYTYDDESVKDVLRASSRISRFLPALGTAALTGAGPGRSPCAIRRRS